MKWLTILLFVLPSITYSQKESHPREPRNSQEPTMSTRPDEQQSQQQAARPDPYDFARQIFKGHPDKDSIRYLLERAMIQHRIAINDENIENAARSVYDYRSSRAPNFTEIDILRKMVQDETSSPFAQALEMAGRKLNSDKLFKNY
jgi:hypothetical protein